MQGRGEGVMEKILSGSEGSQSAAEHYPNDSNKHAEHLLACHAETDSSVAGVAIAAATRR